MLKTKTIAVAGQMFIQYEKEVEESNRTMEGYENYIGVDKNDNDVLNKFFEKK